MDLIMSTCNRILSFSSNCQRMGYQIYYIHMMSIVINFYCLMEEISIHLFMLKLYLVNTWTMRNCYPLSNSPGYCLFLYMMFLFRTCLICVPLLSLIGSWQTGLVSWHWRSLHSWLWSTDHNSIPLFPGFHSSFQVQNYWLCVLCELLLTDHVP